VDVLEIVNIQILPSLEDNFIAQQPEKSGRFTLRSGNQFGVLQPYCSPLAIRALQGLRVKEFVGLFWNTLVPQKMKITAWISIVGALATNEAKWKHHLEVLATCDIFGTGDEISHHALMVCPFIEKIWAAVLEIWPLPDSEELRYIGPVWLFVVLAIFMVDVRVLVSLLIWRICQLLNNLLHNKPVPPTEATRRFSDTYLSFCPHYSKSDNEIIGTLVVTGKQPLFWRGKSCSETECDSTIVGWRNL
jgi:hypothetical protein